MSEPIRACPDEIEPPFTVMAGLVLAIVGMTG
jgi:hypothetical protein